MKKGNWMLTNITFAAFIATSLDGYIARINGKLDWLENSAIKGDSEDYGYQKFMSSVDCIILGRNSFEKIANFSQWPYEGKRVIVISKTLKQPPKDFIDKVEVYGGQLELLAVDLQHKGLRKVYVDGGLTIQSMLKYNLLDEITLTQVPILIGRGIKLYGDLKDDIKLKLLKSQRFPSGFVQQHYQVLRR